MWALMANWFTPTILFCVLNLVIGTIFITSSLRTHDKNQPESHEPDPPPQLVRAPSLLERVRSFNFSLYRSEHSDPVQPETHHVDPPHDEAQDHDPHVTRSKSDTTGEAPPAVRMKKSASEKLMVVEMEVEAEEVDRRRPETMRERNTRAVFGEDEEVDAKADDFINRFKQQLKLQRLDSILRYKDMLNRGSGK